MKETEEAISNNQTRDPNWAISILVPFWLGLVGFGSVRNRGFNWLGIATYAYLGCD